MLLTTTTSTSTTDSGASTGSAYLYRVCAADGSGNCTSDYSNIALGAKLNFTTDATITSMDDDPTGATVTTAKAAHITELRTAINAVRSLADESAGSWTHSGLASGDTIYADDVRDLRSQLNQALGALSIQTSNYTDNTIVSYADNPLNATPIRAVHIRELRTRSTSGAGNSTSGGSSGGLHYVLSDLQGTTRAVMNNSGSSSAVVARHDYLPFGEEIGAGLGLRTTGQAYNATDTNRQKYGLTERDDATGLDHTWWRKLESFSGRWTSPDPYRGGTSDPQSLNGYSFASNEPVNFIDPTGLCSFSVAIDNQSNITADQLQAMKNRISAIFSAAGQQINFLGAGAKGADYNLMLIAAAPSNIPSREVGSTDLTSSRSVADTGRVWVDRLVSSATGNAVGKYLFPVSPNFLGYGLGTAAAHEIGHRLLQQNYDNLAISGIMHASFIGVEWFGAIRTFNTGQIMMLNRQCAPATTTTTVPNNSITLLPVIGGGLGGRLLLYSSGWDDLEWLWALYDMSKQHRNNEGPPATPSTIPPRLH